MSLRRILPLLALLMVAGSAAAEGPATVPPAAAMGAAKAPPPAPPTETVLVGPTGKSLTITPAVLAGLDREQATMINHGAPHTYEGVRLTELLRLVDAPTGARVHAEAVKDYLVVTGADGFRAVLSLAETDGSVQPHPVQRLAADGEDGVVGEGHQAAAVHEAAAVHVLPLGPERADHLAALVRPRIERPGVEFEGIRAPDLPPGPLAFGDLLVNPGARRVAAVHIRYRSQTLPPMAPDTRLPPRPMALAGRGGTMQGRNRAGER